MNLEPVNIPLSKAKIILLIIGSLSFVVVCFWMFGHANNQDRFPVIFVKAISVIGFLLFGVIGIATIRKLFDQKPGLQIDKHGITDNSSSVSVGLIEWPDITSIRKEQMMTTKFILIHVEDPEKYIAKARSKAKQRIMRSNMNMYGTPLSITTNTLKISFDELTELLTKWTSEINSSDSNK